MNGAHALIRTLTGSGVDVCFSNPGTSEMHFVAALDAVPEMRGVLCLFEGVATGAADGYGRMAGRPAAALLHLGPGLGNGLANLHNARRARTPLLLVVGDHATYHKRFDAPLESDIEALAGTVSRWVRRSARSVDVAADAAEAVAAAMRPPGGISTLILPADVSWSEGAEPAPPLPVRSPASVPQETIESVAGTLRSGEPCVLLLGGPGVRRPGLEAASRVAQATGARLLCETFPARLERGAGIPGIDRLAYLAEFAAEQLAGGRHFILAGGAGPGSFFRYPGEGELADPARRRAARAGRARRRRVRRARAPGGPGGARHQAAGARGRAPGAAVRRPEPHRGGRGGGRRRAAARGRDRVRRGQHVRAVGARGHGPRAAAPLADAERRGPPRE